MNAQEVAMALKIDDMNKVLATLSAHNSAHFLVIALRPSQVPEAIFTRNCRLMLPAWFFKDHKDNLKLQDFVVLSSALSIIPCKVRLRVSTRARAQRHNSETYFGKGWKAFARINELKVGDSLIFHLRGKSEFQVYIFRGTGNPTTVSSSHAPPKCSTDSSDLSGRSAQYDSSAGCSAHQHLSGEGSDGLQGLPEDLCEAIAKKRKLVGSEEAAAVCTPENPSLIKLRLTDLENVQVSSVQMRHGLRSGQEPQRSKKTTSCVHNCDVRKLVHVKEEFQFPIVSLPSFIQRLVKFNVQDTAGNTSGACFDVPRSFVRKHNIQLQPHVKLQGIRGDSPFRVVTCTYNMLQDSEERSSSPPLSLGWGDFVRDNALQAGQQLVFTLVSESFFVIREVYEIVVYTK
ncbi:hypothetical protein M758_2G168900 [Ceratodon purpureus]|nr:hypothetical protein M758_2G168900 [Ceratodon purpureus]